MDAPGTPQQEDRIASLEREVRELRARIAALEKLLAARAEHPGDSSVVRGKVTYDWQA